MKRLVAFILILMLVPSVSLAEEPQTGTVETVIQMSYILKLPDVIREGLYSGELLNGVPHGYGTFTAANSEGVNWHYLGEWENGCVTGQGGMYWDNGATEVGIFENGDLVCGEMRNSGTKAWIDSRPDEQGKTYIKYYREDETIYLEECYDAETGEMIECTLYSKNEEVFFKGMPGDGFDWSLIYIE